MEKKGRKREVRVEETISKGKENESKVHNKVEIVQKINCLLL